MKHLVSRELFAYWDRLRGARSAPERGDIDPAAIRAVLAHTFVLEVDGTPDARDVVFRLSGTRLNALVMHELKGHSLLSLFDTDRRGAVVDVVHTVLDDQVGVVAGLLTAPPGMPPINLELILLPLRHHGRTHSRVLGALAPSRVPSWLGLLPIGTLTLVSFRTLKGGSSAGFSRARDPGAAWTFASPPGRAGSGQTAAARTRFTLHQGGR